MITIPKNVLKAVSLFAAKKDIRFYLNAVCVTQKKDHVILAAACGSMLMAYRLDQPAPVEKSHIIPLDSIKTALSWKKARNQLSDEIYIDLETSRITVADNSQTLTYHAVDHIYPNFASVVPTKVSGVPCCFDADLISVCSEALVLLAPNKRSGSFKLRYNGPAAAVIDTPDDNALILIMPMRDPTEKADYARPAWIV